MAASWVSSLQCWGGSRSERSVRTRGSGLALAFALDLLNPEASPGPASTRGSRKVTVWLARGRWGLGTWEVGHRVS